MKRPMVIVAGVLAVLAAMSGVALALPVSIFDTQSVKSYKGAVPSSYGGAAWHSTLGANPPFGTTQIDVEQVGADLVLKLYSPFLPSTVGVGDARFADIFLAVDEAGGNYATPYPTGWDYGLSLGTQVTHGGLAAGLYDLGTYKTSIDQWTSKTGYWYGGKWATCAPPCAGALEQDAPVIVTGGTKIHDVTYGVSGNVTTITVAGWAPETPLQIFWGTADCSNDPIFGEVPELPTSVAPEPGTLALLGTGLVALGAVLRRKVRRTRV